MRRWLPVLAAAVLACGLAPTTVAKTEAEKRPAAETRVEKVKEPQKGRIRAKRSVKRTRKALKKAKRPKRHNAFMKARPAPTRARMAPKDGAKAAKKHRGMPKERVKAPKEAGKEVPERK